MTGSVGSTEGPQQPVNYNVGRLDNESMVDQVSSGFAQENTIAHEGRNPIEDGIRTGFNVDLPAPTRDVADTTPEIQEELANSTAGLERYSVEGVFDQDGDGVSAIDEVLADLAAGKVDSEEALTARIAEEGLEGFDLESLMAFEEVSSDVQMRMAAIESAPPELMKELNGLMGDAERALSMGNIEDVAAILSRIQTKLRDERIKFDQESLIASKEARESVHAGRVEKLVEAIKKMEEQAKTGVIGKVFGAIATALAMVVGTILIATGVLSKVGVVLMVASMALMAAITISQNSGNWMNKVFGENKIAQMVAGIMWSVLAIALSLGASFATAKKGSYDLVQQAVDTTTKLATYAKMASHVAKFGAAGAMASSGAADIHAARVGYEGNMYKASATDDLAYMTKMQQHMDDMLEAIERAIKEINEGQEIASGMMREALDSKFSVAKNI